MEPFTPEDPLWKLMGKARPVLPRANFTQNVLRAARQEAQARGWQARVSEWLAAWRRPLTAGIAATAVLMAVGLVQLQPSGDDGALVSSAAPMVPDAEMAALADEDMSAPLDSLDHMDALVAMEDTSKLTDTELQFLLY
ncbi:MAG: hypothetical protein JWO89_161 [Verrucomicrobiaceae bacterium]|nr:hypothetical protein [Verrucomicrobiaceae bacterium]